jgi:hypothetical protein
VEQHQLCEQAFQPPQLPSRVLEIIGPETLRLHAAQPSEVANYACLSHCWGDKQPIQTTTTSLDAYTKNIPWAELPETFKHAVHVTAELGLRYLWIDSLCIVQDDKEDWRFEGSKMSQIYMNSYITIAATASKDSSEGLFRDHGHEHATKTHQFRDETLREYDVHVRKSLPHFQTGDCPTEEEGSQFPLLQRAWVYQERLLSPRVVHFGPEELLWECLDTTTCECQCWKVWLTKAELMDKAMLGRREGLDSVSQKHNVNKPWWWIVSQYSQHKLKFEGDIFPALQGIAKTFFKVKGSAYYAGLWEDSLIHGLTWSCSTYTQGVRPQTWRAPSWSWAYIVGPVIYTHAQEALHETFATLLSVEVTPVGSDSFGEIASASLTLAGSALSVTLNSVTLVELIRSHAIDSEPLDSETYNSQLLDFEAAKQTLGPDLLRCTISYQHASPNSKDVEFNHDYDLRPLGRSQIWAFKLATADNGGLSHYFLVLRRVDVVKQTFERVGLAVLYDYYDREFIQHFEDNASPLTVTII